MAIRLYFRSALARMRNRDDCALHMYVLSTQAFDRFNQVAVALERHMDQENGLAPKVESKSTLYEDVNQKLLGLLDKIMEQQAFADEHRRR
jgi:hypothetical protein